MTIDFSAALSSLSAFVILLDQHLYGGLILKALAKAVVLGNWLAILGNVIAFSPREADSDA